MKKGINIAIFGSSLLSAYWNGAATYYRGIIHALHRRGHRVTFYEPDAYERQQHRDIDPPDWARVVVYENSEGKALKQIESAREADLVIKASGVGVFDAMLESAVLDIKRSDNVVAFWDVDAPATLDRVNADVADEFRGKIPKYDLVLTYGGGAPVVNAYQQLGARACAPIYNALDPATHFRVPRETRFLCDLAFLGNRLPDREARVDEFFFGPARELARSRFLLGGSGWGDKGMPANIGYAGHIYTADHNALNASALAVLNISRASMARYGFSPATRVFESAGAGACVLSDAWEGIEEFFEPDKELLVARNGGEVVETVSRLTAQRAGEIGQAAYRRVLAQHTYAHRAVELEKVLEGNNAL